MKRVLVDVDVQNDFADPKGALFVPHTELEPFRKLVRHAAEHGLPILGSIDSHAYDAWEFASSGRRGPQGETPGFPDHCVKGTWGWLKPDGTLPPRFRFVPNQPGAEVELLASELASRASDALYFEKEVYSLFANPNAESVVDALVRRASDEIEFVVFGLATDYCVRAAALGLCSRGHRVLLLEDAIWGISAEGSQQAKDEMLAAGARFGRIAELGL